MAVPDIQNNFLTITDAETTDTWARTSLGNYDAGGNANELIGADYVIQGANSWAWSSSNRNNAGIYTSSAITLTDSDHVYFWLFVGPGSGVEPILGATGAAGNYAGDGGGSVFVGTATTAVNIYAVAGPETYGASGRNYINYPIYYDNTVATDSDTFVIGTPGASPTIFGGGVNFQAQSRGPNAALDAIRKGNALSITEGDAANPGTFLALNTYADSENGRYGIFTGVGGGYELNGRISIGETLTIGTADSAYFVDPGTTIVIPDSRHCLNDLSQIRVSGGANSLIDLVSMSYTALSSELNRGVYRSVSKVSTINLTRCVFNNIEIIELGLSTTADGTSFTNCNTVEQDSALMTNCNFVNSRAAVSALTSTDPSRITNSAWTGENSGHGIELLVAGPTGTYDASNWTVTGYNASTGSNLTPNSGPTDAFFYNNSGAAVTINLINGTQSFSVRNGVGATTTLATPADITITGLLGLSEITVLPTAGSPYSGNSLGTAIATTETVSANIFVGDNTDYISYSNNGGNVRINTNGAFVFSTAPGVLSDAEGDLAAGDVINVQVRNNDLNPTLGVVDQFTVAGTPTTTTIDTTTTFSTFVSNFGTALNAANSRTVSVEKTDASYLFTTPVGTEYDVLVFRIASENVLVLKQIASTGNLPLSQSFDRNYRNPA
jgi:hypothetical protein